ncbi:MAG: type II toxin-antitoxin system VapC family toxin [Pirellulaceae bacterium]
MSFLLDTDICSAHLKQRPGLTHRFIQHMGRLHISAITLGELSTWVSRKNASPKRLAMLQMFLSDVVVLDVDFRVAKRFGQLRAVLLDTGQPTPEMDLLIAATALEHGLVLITHNVADYANIPGLTIEDWLVP